MSATFSRGCRIERLCRSPSSPLAALARARWRWRVAALVARRAWPLYRAPARRASARARPSRSLLLGARRSLADARGSPPAEGRRRGRARSQRQPDDRRSHRADGRRRAPRSKSASPRSAMSRRVSSRAGKADADNHGTRLFSALQSALAPTCRPNGSAAAIMVTDGIVHDIPADAAALGFKAPLHALITGHEGERDRRIELVEAPRFGIVGKDQTISRARPRHRRRGRAGGDRRCVATATKIATLTARDRRDGQRAGAIDHAGPNVVELEVAPMPDELTDAQQQGRRHDRRRARQAAGAAGVGRAASGRAHVAQSAEVGRQRRSRPFHHSAPAGKVIGRHADQRTVADRLSGRRSVRPQDQGFRPDHLRPLFEPERSCRRSISTISSPMCARAARC